MPPKSLITHRRTVLHRARRFVHGRRNRLTAFTRAGAATRYTWDANGNRLTSIDTASADTDLDGSFDADDFTATTAQTLAIAADSNRLLGFTQTMTSIRGTRTLASSSAQVNYSIDAAGNLTSDRLRSFNMDANGRLAQVRLGLGSEEAATLYLHNAMGQRVFKSEPQATQYAPDEEELGEGFIAWLKKNFGWLFAKAQANATLGQSFVYADAPLPEWALLGEYGNGASKSAGRLEIVWLPIEDGSAIPVGLYRNGRFYAVHPDHLGTPRLITDDGNKPVWQWPYSGFGANKPTGILKATPKPKQAWTNEPMLLKGTNPAISFNLRFPGQYFDEESNLNYNYLRSYQAAQGRYTQFDPIGLRGGPNGYLYANANPVSNIDPAGLVTWSGTLNVLAMQAAGGGGGATINYMLKSECLRGQRFIVQGEGVGGYMALGWQVGASTSQVSFDDGLDYINPFIFNGPFDLVTAGGSFGVGWGWSSMNLGGAHAAGSTSWYNGRDLGLVGMHGRSKVSSVKLEECSCDAK